MCSWRWGLGPYGDRSAETVVALAGGVVTATGPRGCGAGDPPGVCPAWVGSGAATDQSRGRSCSSADPESFGTSQAVILILTVPSGRLVSMSVTVEVANVGPIRHAHLSIGELNVLIGPNDTGKTFFATVVHRLFVSRFEAYFPKRIPAETIPDPIFDFLEQSQALLLRDEAQATDTDFLIDDDTRAWANQVNESTLQRYGVALRRAIAYAYGVPIDKLLRQPDSYGENESFVSVENSSPRWSVKIPMDVRVEPVTTCPNPDKWIRRVFNLEDIHPISRFLDPLLLIEKENNIAPRQRIERICELLLYQRGDTTLFREWPVECLHLPSERGGIMQSYRAITSAALRKVSVAGIEPIEIEPLDGTCRDFLSFVVSPESPMANESFADLASEVEKQLRAEINVSKSPTGIDQIVVTTPEGEFQLNQSSSMLSELTALLLALKHRLDPGDYLTIDEPEAHLHPEMQIEVAKLLVNLASAGLTVTLTTHSDYFLEQVNNTIRSSQLMIDASDDDMPLGPRISYDRVRALSFTRGDDGCSAEDTMGDVVDPIREDTFTAASRHQYNESVPLINRLLERSNTAR